MNTANIKNDISSGATALGIEFGSTRIKAVLTDSTHSPVASGSYTWENRLENGIWTYSEQDIFTGLRAAYKDLCDDVMKRYGVSIHTIGAIGISAMMHGYIALDENDKLLVPFRTWRNNITSEAAQKLTEMFNFNIPERFSIAHLYQAILNGEEHVASIKRLTTLAGYVHLALTGEHILGAGDASGMFPIDPETADYDENKSEIFDRILKDAGLPFALRDILPASVRAKSSAGKLTAQGAELLDPTGTLCAGIPFCPPEGDAGTGMVATNSVTERTGNISAGTSVFAMTVLERSLLGVYPEIDVVATPDGAPVAMVHANNCTSDINAWAGIFKEVLKSFGKEVSDSKLYETLFKAALSGDADCGKLLSYGYLSGENITKIPLGRPLFVRGENAAFTLSNFMRNLIYSSLGALKIGLDILFEKERVQCDLFMAHGGLFKTEGVAQSFMAAAANVPVCVNTAAGEGGAWGIALLAAYMHSDKTLSDFLNDEVFAECEMKVLKPEKATVDGFIKFMETYKAGLSIERAAVDISEVL